MAKPFAADSKEGITEKYQVLLATVEGPAESSHQIYSGTQLLSCDFSSAGLSLWVNTDQEDGGTLSGRSTRGSRGEFRVFAIWSLGWLEMVVGKAKERRANESKIERSLTWRSAPG